MKKLRSIIGIVLFLGIASFVVFQVINLTSNSSKETLVEKMKSTSGSSTSESEKNLKLVAIGDSLTEGVGDSTSRGGYVPLVAEMLEANKEKSKTVSTSNYGVSGNRSDQILKRVKEDSDLQKDVEQANVIVLTVGGNDLMKVVKSELLNVSEASFVTPQKEYQERVKSIFSELRKMNPDAPIFIFGIYNPFYLYFTDIPEMQKVVRSWNQATEAVAKEEKETYFIPIDDLLSKGEGNKEAVTAGSSNADSEEKAESSSNSTKLEGADDFSSIIENSEIVNNLLFEEDHFHPNDLGYHLMAKALYEKMMEYPKTW